MTEYVWITQGRRRWQIEKGGAEYWALIEKANKAKMAEFDRLPVRDRHHHNYNSPDLHDKTTPTLEEFKEK